MHVIPYEPEMARLLVESYNQLIRGLPHCYPASAGDFAIAVSATVGGEPSDERLHSENAFVAWEGDAPLGFIHIGVERPRKEEASPRGIIRFAWYERGHRAAGQALLSAAEDVFVQRDIGAVRAFHQHYVYAFYHLHSAYLSDRVEHVHALFSSNGYRRVGGEVYLDWPNFTPLEPPASAVTAEVTLSWREGAGKRPNLVVLAHRGQELVGECVCESQGNSSRPAEAEDWLFTDWIGVSESVRGRGLGRYLLQRALLEMHAVGYRHATISTAWENHRALLFYSNFGYRAVDWTYGFGKDLKAGVP
jgi:ribosomal protein S18 acetylase RimI-like enzyme